LEIYGLTVTGRKLARSTNNPSTPEWQIIHYLDRVNRSTKENIAEYCGLNPVQAAVSIRKLKASKIIAEESEANV